MTNIQLTFDPGTSLQQMIAFEMAAQVWESHLSDPINLGDFSTGEASELMQSIQMYVEGEVGDGYQASHWQNQNEILGIMDPTIALGERMQISDLDLTALDVIGWDLQAPTYDLTNLAAQAKSAIAQQLGQTTTWLDQNSETAAAQLSEDRTKDIEKMIKQSKVYDSLWGGGGGNWLTLEEKILALMDYIGAFSTLENPPEGDLFPTPAPAIYNSPLPEFDLLTGTRSFDSEEIVEQLLIPDVIYDSPSPDFDPSTARFSLNYPEFFDLTPDPVELF